MSLRIAIIGAGAAGRQFAASCALAGFSVVLEDVMPARLRRAGQDLATLGAEIDLVSTVEDAVAGADLAVDFVPDELESKLEIFSLLDRMSPPRTILCTPSQGLSITDLASCTYREDRCVMVRDLFDTHAPARLLVGRRTSAHTSSVICSMLTGLGRAVTLESDPDLPMLMRNMGDFALHHG